LRLCTTGVHRSGPAGRPGEGRTCQQDLESEGPERRRSRFGSYLQVIGALVWLVARADVSPSRAAASFCVETDRDRLGHDP
jgi:hypothetical protein